MMANTTTRTWGFPRRIADDMLGLTFLVWAGFVLTIGIIIGLTYYFDSVTQSFLAEATGVVGPFTAFIGGYIMYALLPRYVANGRTRRDFAIESAIFLPVFAVFAATLMTIAYAIEWAVFRMADWEQDVMAEHLFTSATDWPLIFSEHLFVVLVWAASGAFVGAAIYRDSEGGWLSIIVALFPIGIAGIAMQGQWGPIGSLYEWAFGSPPDLPLAVNLLIALLCAAASTGLTWLVIRDTPLRSLSK